MANGVKRRFLEKSGNIETYTPSVRNNSRATLLYDNITNELKEIWDEHYLVIIIVKSISYTFENISQSSSETNLLLFLWYRLDYKRWFLTYSQY